MTDNRYTAIVDFRGGTYVSQVQASDEREAIRAWAEKFRAERPIPRLSSRLASNVLNEMEDDPPVPLTGLQGVWCFTTSFGGSLVLMNLVLSR